MNFEIRNAIESYLNAGLCALPATSARKCPVGSWKQFQTRLPSMDEIDAMLNANPEVDAVAIICGKVSGNLEVIDFDWHGYHTDEWAIALQDCGINLNNLCIEETQNHGNHVAYRSNAPVDGNDKLTHHIFADDELDFANGKAYYAGKEILRNSKGQYESCTIETRGEGGLIICAPSNGYKLLTTGVDWTHIPVVDAQTIEMFKAVAKTLDNTPEVKSTEPVARRQYVNTGNFESSEYVRNVGFTTNLLASKGWKFAYSIGSDEVWTRPGKQSGPSAIVHPEGNIHVFTTSVPDLPQGSYSPMQVFRMLNGYQSDKEASKAIFDIARANGDLPSLPLTPCINMTLDGLTKANEDDIENANKTIVKKGKKTTYIPLPKEVRDYLDNESQFLKAFADRTFEATGFNQPEYYFMAGLSVLSFITSKHLYTIEDTRPNINVSLVGTPGSGKSISLSHATACVREFLNGTDKLGYVSGGFESIQAAYDTSKIKGPLCFWRQDEFHTWLEPIVDGKSTTRKGVLDELITAGFGNENKERDLGSSRTTKKIAKTEEEADDKFYCNLTMLNASQMRNVVPFVTNEKIIGSGIISRFLYCVGRSASEARNKEAFLVKADKPGLSCLSDVERVFINYWKTFEQNFPKSAKQQLADMTVDDFSNEVQNDFAQFSDPSAPTCLQFDGYEYKDDEGFKVPFALVDRMKTFSDEFDNDEEERRNLVKKYGESSPQFILFDRLCQYRKKFALLLAADRFGGSNNPAGRLVIDDRIYNLACLICRWILDIETSLACSKEADASADGNEAVRLCRRFLEQVIPGDDGMITLKKFDLNNIKGFTGAKARKAFIEQLESLEAIEVKQVPGKTRPSVIYVIDAKRLQTFIDD